ncbi:cation acetate symporter [Geobacter hydrogenophilus]|uniref:Cation acetate symporter n=1 Tax=Geobacter hydrogenophilus TaxID=40983 RepID=A0A9W6G2W9_9BACT|nr:cation acetate symporter [Geobacter hydrogenophilus]MBT0894483.1 cation acetate symporter [Geobacter hydrogenophilus]GLI39362.1 cation acetate symporter [Geobacter hydrogenophilus]
MKHFLIAMILCMTICPLCYAAPPAQGPATAAPAVTGTSAKTPPSPANEVKTNKAITLSMFAAIILLTGAIVVRAAKSTRTAADYYAAGGGISGMQNGWAIAGDYLSAATFLGIAGITSVFGADGFMYAVGPFFSFVTILLVIAEPCRNAGKYTLGDILSLRSTSKIVRGTAALSAVVVSTFYLLAQMVGAGKLMQLLLGIPYNVSIIGVGALMILYVTFGGMKATTWVQIIKAFLLVLSGVTITMLLLWKFGFNLFAFYDAVASSPAIQEHVRGLLKHAAPQPGFDYGQRFLEPGLILKNPLDQVSLGMAFALGAAGLPHIMMRFFTVPNAKAARKSVVISMVLIGAFMIMVTIIGFGAALFITPQQITAVDKGGNMAAPMIAQYVGGGAGSVGGDLFLAFVCAVAFSTIIAVVSGLILAVSAAVAHDFYVNVLKDGKPDQREQMKIAKLSAFVIGAVAIVFGIACEKQNIAHLVVLAFAVVASSNFPVILFALFWKRFNAGGIVTGLTVGAIFAIGVVLVSPTMTYPKKIAADAKKVVDQLETKQASGVALADKELKALVKARADYAKNRDGKSLVGLDAPLFPLKNPAILSIPVGFLAAIAGTFLFGSRREEEKFDELYIRQNTGYGMADASDH